MNYIHIKQDFVVVGVAIVARAIGNIQKVIGESMKRGKCVKANGEWKYVIVISFVLLLVVICFVLLCVFFFFDVGVRKNHEGTKHTSKYQSRIGANFSRYLHHNLHVRLRTF
jgi:uncharacterized membrane protein SpoIIM required for sporulation